MYDSENLFSLHGKSPLYQLLVAVMAILVVGVGLFFIMIMSGTLIFSVDIKSILGNPSEVPGENEIDFLRYLIISQDVSLFIVPSVIVMIMMRPVRQERFEDIRMPLPGELLLVMILSLCLLPLTSFTGHLNADMQFPEWLSGVEEWMTEKEDDAEQIISLLIKSDSTGALLFNILLIAVLPAISEELIFRGVFQKIMYGFFRRGHFAIWLTAFVFSAIHLQFFGFLPRFILGLVFGYLFYWSGTLWLPVISHFVNNLVPVVGAYIQGWDKLNEYPDDNLWKHTALLPLSLAAALLILLYFRNKSVKRKRIHIEIQN
jgi:uncharacterized protein